MFPLFVFIFFITIFATKIFGMFNKIYDILVSIMGESKQGGYIKGCFQYQFNCIMTCAEEKGGPDGKYNLEVSFAMVSIIVGLAMVRAHCLT